MGARLCFWYKLCMVSYMRDLSENTKLNYASDLRQYLNWCKPRGREPLEVSTLELYVQWVAEKRTKTFRSLRRHVVGIGRMLELEHDVNPTHDEYVRKALYSARDALDVEPETRDGLTFEEAKGKAAAVSHDNPARTARDQALILLSAVLDWPHSEILGLDVEHIEWRPGAIRLQRTYATSQNPGLSSTWLDFGEEATDLVWNRLSQWLFLAQIQKGPVFRGIDRWGNVRDGRLRRDAMFRILTQNVVTDEQEVLGETAADATNVVQIGSLVDNVRPISGAPVKPAEHLDPSHAATGEDITGAGGAFVNSVTRSPEESALADVPPFLRGAWSISAVYFLPKGVDFNQVLESVLEWTALGGWCPRDDSESGMKLVNAEPLFWPGPLRPELGDTDLNNVEFVQTSLIDAFDPYDPRPVFEHQLDLTWWVAKSLVAIQLRIGDLGLSECYDAKQQIIFDDFTDKVLALHRELEPECSVFTEKAVIDLAREYVPGVQWDHPRVSAESIEEYGLEWGLVEW